MSQQEIALITGGSRGIGAAIARTLARDGYDIWLNYRSDHDAAKEVGRQIGEQGRSCRLLPFDVADSASVKGALAPLLESDTPSVLVNNAGFSKDVLMVWMEESEWKQTLSVHLDGFFLVTRMVLLGMLKKKSGRIIKALRTLMRAAGLREDKKVSVEILD